MSITTKTFTATPRLRSESAFMPLGTGNDAHGAGMWRNVTPPVAGNQSLDLPTNPIYTRNRAVVAAKQGSPPRGDQR